uniref:Conserved domain protein n=1 Tax=Heterorhabditis bacteriophora TaxID=37862 RepID=A0A1I7X1C1_HETBA
MLTSDEGEDAPFIVESATNLSQIFKNEVDEGFLQYFNSGQNYTFIFIK